MVQETVQIVRQLVGHGVSMSGLAVPFDLLNSAQTLHLVNTPLHSTKNVFSRINFCPLYK